MAGKTLIGGTSYTISGGKTLIGGTAYSINGGKTLIDGTLKSISFGRLPSGYTEVNRITSNSGSYINTGIAPNNNTRVVTKLTLPNTAGWVLGARKTSTSASFVILFSNSNHCYRTDFNGININMTESPTWAYPVVIDKNKNVTTVVDNNNKSYTYTHSSGTFSCSYPMYIFNGNNPSGTTSFSTITMYSCQIYDNNTKVRDFVPCINPSNQVGMYDLVSNTFFGNSGTGTFTAGNTV